MNDLLFYGSRPFLNEDLGITCANGLWNPGTFTSDGNRYIGGWFCYSVGYGHSSMSDVVLAADSSVKKYGTGSLKMQVKSSAKFIKDVDSHNNLIDGVANLHIPYVRVGKYIPYHYDDASNPERGVSCWFRLAGSDIRLIRFDFRQIRRYLSSGNKVAYASIEYDHSNGNWYWLTDQLDANNDPKWSKDLSPAKYLFTKSLSTDVWYAMTFMINSNLLDYLNFYLFNENFLKKGDFNNEKNIWLKDTTYVILAKLQVSLYATQDHPTGSPTLYLNRVYAGAKPDLYRTNTSRWS